MKRLNLMVQSIIFVFVSSALVIAVRDLSIAQTANAYYATATNLPETNAPATTTPHVFCRVQYLVSIKPGVSINVRPTPSRNTTPQFTLNGTPNPHSAIDSFTLPDGSKWFQLCSINQQYMINDPSLDSFVTVTPSPTQSQPTPTRLVTNTPQPSATVAPTATPNFDWISIDTDHNGFGDYTLRCRMPCAFVITDKEPSGTIMINVTEWPTRSPTP